MATSSFFYNGSNAPQVNTNEVVTSVDDTENTVKSSFFYGQGPGPEQNTVSKLLADLDVALAQATAANEAAIAALASVQPTVNNAATSASSASNSAALALIAKDAAEAARVATEAAKLLAIAASEQATLLVAQANDIISSFTISTSDPSGGTEGDVWFKVSF